MRANHVLRIAATLVLGTTLAPIAIADSAPGWLAVEWGSDAKSATSIVRSSGWTAHRGEAQLDEFGPFRMQLSEPVHSAQVTLRDPQADSLFEIRTYRGIHALESALVRFDDSRTGFAAIESDSAFDRIEIVEVHDGYGKRPESILSVQLGLSSKGGLSPNAEAALCQALPAVAYNFAFGAGIVAIDPINAAIANAAAYTSNLALKFCPSVIEPPQDLKFRVPSGQCSVQIQQERVVSDYENALGIPLAYDYDWGDLGTPFVYHHNTEVEVSLTYGTPKAPTVGSLSLSNLFSPAFSIDATDNIYAFCSDDGTVETSSLPGDTVEYACPYVANRTLEFPVGRNPVLWRANAKMGILDLISPVIPGLPAAPKVPAYKIVMLEIVRSTSEVALDFFLNGWRWDNVASALQQVTVYDEVPPTIASAPMDQPRITASIVGGNIHVQIEADEPGGVSARKYARILERMYNVSDACGRDIASFTPSYPAENLRVFWPVSTAISDETFSITWTAVDQGPNLTGEENQTTATMTVEVVDIRPPAIVPPPDIVEVGTTQVDSLGQPLVFDFVDLDPVITNDATLPLTTGLHEVTWTATDASGNSATAVQIVNIKASNVAPDAIPQTGANRQVAVTFEPQTIRLEGNDLDSDPLRFFVEEYPEHGFFVAPLYPYFVEDFRLQAAPGEADDQTIRDTCRNGEGADRDFDLPFPLNATKFAVDDNGRSFVVDRGRVDCRAGDPDVYEFDQRIVRFGASGDVEESISVGDDTFEDLVVDEFNDIIVATRDLGGLSQAGVRTYDLSLNEIANYTLEDLKERLPDGSEGPCTRNLPHNTCEITDATSAVVDANGLVYVMQRNARIYALDAFREPVLVVGVLSDDVTNNANTALPAGSLALDSDGFIYATRNNRVYKYSPSWIDDMGLAQPGEFVGWMGRCDTDLAPGDEAVCDTVNKRSVGYSCTDTICGIDPVITQEERDFCGYNFSNNGNFGCRPGQFYVASGIDIDPRNVLYVADGGNRRIQRFTVDGFFAGEAESECDGSCFVLGDFGSPNDVSVNADRFFIFDPDTDLLHVSLLTPFTDQGADYAELVYQSNNDFACTLSANCVDSFGFSVSDGVRDSDTGQPARSAVAPVEVEVMRNFRPPVATPGIAWTVDEDVSTSILLDGSDLDTLDILAFAIDESPENGSINVVGNQAFYQSDADYVGSDRFTFTVSDGTETSPAEEVLVTVLNVNDAPRVDPLDDATVAAGYTFPVRHSFIDPDPGDTQLVTVDWGDGTVDSEAGNDGPELVSAGTGPGRITAEHIYTTPGTRTLEVCVTDNVEIAMNGDKAPTPDSETGCAQATITVIDGVDVQVTAQSSQNTVVPGQIVTQSFRALNEPPSAGPANTVTGLRMTVDLPVELDTSSLSVSPAECQLTGQRVLCDPVSLQPGFFFETSITGTVPATTPVGTLLQSRAMVTLDQQDQAPENEAVLTVPVLPPADFTVAAQGDALTDAADTNPGDGQCLSIDGVCTLRAAIEEANATMGQQVIALGNGVYRIEGGLTAVEDSLILLGSGADNTVIDLAGNGALNTGFQVDLRVEDLTITGGANSGINASGNLTVRRSRITGNRAVANFGGGIQHSQGNLDLRDVTIDGNISDNDGGGIFAFVNSKATLVNVSIYGNTGGGITLDGGTHSFTNVTITGNDGGAGWVTAGGALNVFGGANLSMVNTVVAGNRLGARGGTPNCLVQESGSQVQSLGNNAFGDLEGCTITPVPTDLAVLDARLRSADTLSSRFPVVRPFVDSPLVDAGSAAACPDADARGVSRPQDGNEDGASACDIGAVELLKQTVFRDGFE